MENIEKIILSLLNLSSKDVESITSTNMDDHLNLYVTVSSHLKMCPYCHSEKIKSKGYYPRKISVPERVLRNLDVYLKVKRFQCFNCGHSFSDSKHMAPKNKTVSYATILQVMELLKSPSMTFKEVAALSGVSVSTVVRIFDKNCHLKPVVFPEVVCIDEVYAKDSSYKSKYMCIFYDFAKQNITDVLPSRHKSYLHHYFQSFSQQKLDMVRYVCIDMYQPYKDIATIYFKKAIICVDSFHVIKHLNDDLSQIRIRVMKSYDTDSIEYYLLKHFRFLLFDRTVNLDNKGKYNKKLNRIMNYRQLLDMMLSINIDLYNGYNLKEMYMAFNSTDNYDNLSDRLNDIIDEFILANIEEYSEFVGMIQNWRQEILNSFSFYNDKRINNSVAEGINSIISTVMFNSRGIHNFERRKKRIMYAVNKDGFLIK